MVRSRLRPNLVHSASVSKNTSMWLPETPVSCAEAVAGNIKLGAIRDDGFIHRHGADLGPDAGRSLAAGMGIGRNHDRQGLGIGVGLAVHRDGVVGNITGIFLVRVGRCFGLSGRRRLGCLGRPRVLVAAVFFFGAAVGFGVGFGVGVGVGLVPLATMRFCAASSTASDETLRSVSTPSTVTTR